MARSNKRLVEPRPMLFVGEIEDSSASCFLEEFFDLDIRFHDLLWRLSGSALLPRLLSQALIPLLAFLFIRNARDRARIDLKESADAHAEIAEAILGRDKQAARRVVREKFQLFAEQHLRWFEEGARP